MLKTYQSRFAGEYDGRRFLNKIFQTSDEETQKHIEDSKFFKVGEIKLVNVIKDSVPVEAPKKPLESTSIESMSMPALRKKASELGLKVPNTTKKLELIQMIEQVI